MFLTMSDINRRLSELRSEQLRTKDKQKKAEIKGEIQYLNNRKAEREGIYRICVS